MVSRWPQLIPLVFSIARKFGCTNKGAFFAGCLVNFDMLNTAESRLVLMDAQVRHRAWPPRLRQPLVAQLCSCRLVTTCLSLSLLLSADVLLRALHVDRAQVLGAI